MSTLIELNQQYQNLCLELGLAVYQQSQIEQKVSQLKIQLAQVQAEALKLHQFQQELEQQKTSPPAETPNEPGAV